MTIVELLVVVNVVSLVDCDEDELLLLLLDFDVDSVVSVDVGACVETVVVVFGIRESTTPIGPDKSLSSGHVNSSG